MKKVVLSGGGTGGHLNPIISLSKCLTLENPDIQPIIITQRNSVSKKMLNGTKYKKYYINSGKFRRYPNRSVIEKILDIKTLVLNIGDVFKLIFSIFQSAKLLMKLKPSVVFVKGGYVGLPVGIAAKLLNLPLLIHESDVKPGLTNSILAKFANTVMIGWPKENYPKWQNKNLIYTGIIVSKPSLFAGDEAKKFFKLTTDLPVLLFLGGSSGAKVINQTVLKNINLLTKKYQVIHISGKGDYEKIKSAVRKLNFSKKNYHLYEFLTYQLHWAYQLSDLIISRSGANTLAEIAIANKPLILIPHRYSPGSHQQMNAQMLESYGAAIVINEAEIDSKLLYSIEEVISNQHRTQALKKALQRFAKSNSSDLVSKEIMSLL